MNDYPALRRWANRDMLSADGTIGAKEEARELLAVHDAREESDMESIRRRIYDLECKVQELIEHPLHIVHLQKEIILPSIDHLLTKQNMMRGTASDPVLPSQSITIAGGATND